VSTKIEANRIANGREFWDQSEDPVFQVMGYRCQSCDRPFKASIQVEVSLDQWVKNAGAVRCPHCGSNKLYLGMGLSLSEDRALRKGVTLDQRIKDWRENGETGLSSEAVLDYMVGNHAPTSHPHDYADLRRVILLLDRFPEWSSRMGELAGIDGWKGIAGQWDELVRRVLAADPEAKSPQDARDFLEGIYN
jgi:DNA-directed RNA polymerase subunit RPC12/RpoP